MENPFTPKNILAAFNRIKHELPDLVGNDNWQNIDKYVNEKLNLLQSATPSEEEAISLDLEKALWNYERAYQRLVAEITLVSIQDQVIDDVAKLGFDANEIEGLVDDTRIIVAVAVNENTKHITSSGDGVPGGKSVKFKNMHLDFGKMAEIITVAIVAADKSISEARPFIIVAGVLLTIKALTDAMTVKLSEHEISVFWGFVQVRDAKNTASEDAIFKKTNSERKGRRKLLTKEEFMDALLNLEALKSIERVKDSPKRWRLIESYSK